MSEETLLQKAERRGQPYVKAVLRGLAWEEYTKTHPIPKEGEKIKVYDPSTKTIKNAIVIRIAGNGLRADQEGYGIVAVDKYDNGVWY